MPGHWTDKTIVLTGASGGVGVALVEYLLGQGARRLALQYCASPDRLFETLSNHGVDPSCHCFQADLTDESEAVAFGDQVEGAFGPPWGLVTLAGATSNAMSWKLSLQDFQRVLNANLTTTFLACRRFIPAMRAASGGRIVNISSVAAFSGVAGAAHYCAAKAGVVGFTKSLAQELIGRGITANTIALGYFEYGMLHTIPENLQEGIRLQIPAERFGDAADIGGMIAYLLGGDSGYTTGQVLHVNGGLYC